MSHKAATIRMTRNVPGKICCLFESLRQLAHSHSHSWFIKRPLTLINITHKLNMGNYRPIGILLLLPFIFYLKIRQVSNLGLQSTFYWYNASFCSVAFKLHSCNSVIWHPSIFFTLKALAIIVQKNCLYLYMSSKSWGSDWAIRYKLRINI